MKVERRYLEDHPEIVPAIIGGAITITEVTRQGVNSRVVHRFRDYEAMRHAAAAVAARFRHGDDKIDVEAGMCRVDQAIETPIAAAAAETYENRAARRRAEKLARRAARAQRQRVA